MRGIKDYMDVLNNSGSDCVDVQPMSESFTKKHASKTIVDEQKLHASLLMHEAPSSSCTMTSGSEEQRFRQCDVCQ